MFLLTTVFKFFEVFDIHFTYTLTATEKKGLFCSKIKIASL